MVKNNDLNQYDRSNLFTNSDQSSGDATHEYELELISDSSTMIEPVKHPPQQPLPTKSQDKLGLPERALSAAGAAFLSAIIVNPLDVAKTRLQAQAAGVAYSHPMTNLTSRMAVFGPNMMFADLRCSPSCTRAGIHGTVSICPPDCFEYKGTLDVFGKIIRQEGVARLWRGTNAGLALAIPTVGIYLPCYDIFRNWFEEFAAQNAPSMTPYAPLLAGSLSRSLACTTCYPIELARTRMQAFKDFHSGKKAPGVWKTLLDVLSNVQRSENTRKNVQNYRALWTGLGAQLARDVPFSAICWSTLEPVRRSLLNLVGEEANAASVLGANFSAGFVAGSLAAAATCPLDVAKTRRQIERDPARALRMTTRQTLMEVWRDGGIRGLFTGAGPRVGRAGPSVGIVVSFYEVVKYALHHQRATSS
ncbi:mitochondrial carrier protein MTM1-like [Cynara cardunculus var. scolymus]|uniref:mitochondrial carrier protein MTM1-like n=1 Tax=Cynara cardunculus var. scolymus TaxID=59895 RepID=UPI000D62F69B|nr:mitochondrial carrier protein MTM1-like [Cynara cardunculus var. scolymus]